MNREEWLLRCIAVLRALFKAVGATLPADIHVSCGWSVARALAPKHPRNCGVHLNPKTRAFEVFIAPRVADAPQVAALLVVGLACVCTWRRRGAGYRHLAEKLGLLGGKLEALTAPRLNARVHAYLETVVAALPPYPHEALALESRPAAGAGNRRRKVECPSCGYNVLVVASSIPLGLPTCYCGTKMVVAEPAQRRPGRPRTDRDVKPTVEETPFGGAAAPGDPPTP